MHLCNIHCQADLSTMLEAAGTQSELELGRQVNLPRGRGIKENNAKENRLWKPHIISISILAYDRRKKCVLVDGGAWKKLSFDVFFYLFPPESWCKDFLLDYMSVIEISSASSWFSTFVRCLVLEINFLKNSHLCRNTIHVCKTNLEKVGERMTGPSQSLALVHGIREAGAPMIMTVTTVLKKF